MYMLACLLLAFGAAITLLVTGTTTVPAVQPDVAALAQNYAIYANAVRTYHEANPAVSGTIPDTNLSFAPYFKKLGNWTNAVCISGAPAGCPASPTSVVFISGTFEASQVAEAMRDMGYPLDAGTMQASGGTCSVVSSVTGANIPLTCSTYVTSLNGEFVSVDTP